MSIQPFAILQSHLDAAKNTGDRNWLEETIRKGRQTIEAGGEVHLMQEFSDARREIVKVIDNHQQLDHLAEKYAP